MSRLLLDTHALLWLHDGSVLSAAATRAIAAARARQEKLLVSPVSIWEIGMLIRKGRVRVAPDLPSWTRAMLRSGDFKLAPVGWRILADASALPGEPHGDPFDQALIATARRMKTTLITRDRQILTYAQLGHLDALAC